jgi:hypothetical protein
VERIQRLVLADAHAAASGGLSDRPVTGTLVRAPRQPTSARRPTTGTLARVNVHRWLRARVDTFAWLASRSSRAREKA